MTAISQRGAALRNLARYSGLPIHDDSALLEWAAMRTDQELRFIRNIGPAALRWIRANQPLASVDALVRRLGGR